MMLLLYIRQKVIMLLLSFNDKVSSGQIIIILAPCCYFDVRSRLTLPLIEYYLRV